MPLAWEELSDSATRPDRWTIETVPARLERDGDPYDLDASAQPLGGARRAVGELG